MSFANRHVPARLEAMSLIEGDKFVNAEGAMFLQRAAPPEFDCALDASGQIMEIRALPGAILAQVTDQPPQATARSSQKLRDQRDCIAAEA